MFILTLKLPSRRFLAGTAAALCLLAAGGGLPSPPEETVTASAALSVGKLHSNGDRADFLRSLGWSVSEEPLSVESLLIPLEMENSEYMSLQQKQGFNLPGLAGQRVKRYIYTLESSPNLQLELLIFQGRVVGGSVYSLEPEGTLSPLLPSD